METRLVNVKVSSIRPNYDNLKEWMEYDNNIYIGRKGIVFVSDPDHSDTNKKCRWPKKDSVWCNPYKISKTMTREQSLIKYEEHLRMLLEDDNIMEEFKKLRGKTLGCWCHPEKCHGDIIIKLLDEIK
jgi:hypothetical protein